MCLYDACSWSSCPAHPHARCRMNYCGQCAAEFYDRSGAKVDCQIGSFCFVFQLHGADTNPTQFQAQTQGQGQGHTKKHTVYNTNIDTDTKKRDTMYDLDTDTDSQRNTVYDTDIDTDTKNNTMYGLYTDTDTQNTQCTAQRQTQKRARYTSYTKTLTQKH